MVPLQSVNTFAVLSRCYATNFGASYDNLRLEELEETGWRKVLETAAEGDRENTAGVVEYREIGLIPRVVVFRGN